MSCARASVHAWWCDGVSVYEKDRMVLKPRSDRHHRWLTSREALLCQGFPILKSFSHGIPVCGFALDGYELDTWDNPDVSSAVADSERTSRIGQAGNAMHLQAVGLAMAYVLSRGNSDVSQLDKVNFGRLLPPQVSSRDPSETAASGARLGLLEQTDYNVATSESSQPAMRRDKPVSLAANLLGLARMITDRK